MPTIQLSDGRTVQFPDGMSQDDMAAALKKLPPAKPSSPSGVLPFIDNVARQFSSGATFGGADELAAAASAGLGYGTGSDFAERYQGNVAAERAQDAAFAKDHPYVAGAANIAGAMASPINKFLPGGRAQTMGGAYAKGAIGGGLAGLIEGYLSGEGSSDSLTGAMKGAAIGGPLGMGMTAVLHGASKIFPSLRPAPTADTNAKNVLLRDLDRDGISLDQLQQASRAAAANQRPAMLVDLAGENTLNAAEAVTKMPGRGRQMAADALAARGGVNQSSRLANDIKRHVSDIDFGEAEVGLLAIRRQSEPLWREAMSKPVGMTNWLRHILDDPLAQAGLKKGVRIQEIRNLSMPENMRMSVRDAGLQFAEDGTPKIVGQPNMFTLQMVKEGLDNIIDGAKDSFGRIQWTKELRAIDDFRKTYVGLLKESNPTYAEALKRWADPSEALDAMRLGRNIMTLSPQGFEVSSKAIAGLDEHGKKFARIGLARALLDRVESTTDAQELTKLNRLFGSVAVRRRIRSLFDDDKSFNELATTVHQEIQMARNDNFLRGGSRTMSLQEKAADLRSVPTPGVNGNLTGSDALSLSRDLVNAGKGGVAAPFFRMVERGMDRRGESRHLANMDALSPYLFTTDAAKREELIRALMAHQLANTGGGQWGGVAREVPSIVRRLRSGAAAGIPMALDDK